MEESKLGRGGMGLWALAAAALVVRAAYLVLEPRCALTGDEPSWIELGRQLARPAVAFSPLRSDLVFYPPVYPYLVGALFRLFGSMGAVLWVQVVLGVLLVPVVGRAAARAFGPRASVLAAAFTAFYPELVWYPAHFWSETVFLLLLWAAIERALAADAAASWRTAAAAGVLFGLATLTRELSLYLVPLVALWMARPWAVGANAAGTKIVLSRKRLVAAGALALATVLTVAPWTLRNALVFRAFIPVSTMGGLNLWQGNTSLTHLQIYDVLAGIDGPVAQDRYCRRLAWETIAARQPGWLFEKLGEQMPEFWKAGSEVLDHLVGRDACGPLAPARLVVIELVLVLPYLAVLALALVGAARLRFTPPAVLLLVLAAAYNAAHVAAYATTRFRLPVLPVLFMLAGALIVGRGDDSLAPLRGRRLALLAL
ncbi:MAG TPA: glycosyltransferase family 39 protein, partial [Planctomycetota bacterium]|nr:glycosyltransferase family 39 protein [Planctomycetota bacterium]